MITRLLYPSVILGVALTSAALAADETPEVKTAGYHLKNQSAFQVAPGTRAPFWPIGWAPSGKATTDNTPAEPASAITADQFSVTSILLGSKSFAVINGRTYGEGEFIRAARPVKAAPGTAAPAASTVSASLRIRVNRIIDGQVILQAAGQSAIAVPLRRPQLSERKPGDDELLSLSDR